LRSLISANAPLLVAGILTFALMGAGQSIYGPALPAFAREFGLTVGQVGWLVSAQWIGSALGVVIMLLAGRHLGPRHALGLLAAGAAMVAAGPGWWGTLAASVIFGIGYGVAGAVFNPRVLVAFADKGPSMLSLLNATFAAGAILAPLAFVAIGGHPQLAFAGIAGIAALVFLLAGPDRDRAGGEARATAPYRFRPLVLTFALFGIAIEASLIGLGPTALIRAGMTEAEAAQLLSAFFVAFLIARMLLVFFAHMMRPFDIYLYAMAVSAGCALAAVLLPPGVFFVLMGASAGWFFPGTYVTATRLMGDHPNVAPTILGAGLVGGIASPVIVASLVDGMGERGFFLLVGSLALAVTLAAVALRRRLDV
jgi:fucose permease